MDGEYDAIVVGAGVCGSACAYALAKQGRKIALIERDWSEPDRIVGELLQPGGIKALQTLGLPDCVEGIDGITVNGYVVFKNGEQVLLPYPTGTGKSFHHGRFIMKLRQACKSNPNIYCVEATASTLIKCEITGRNIGLVTNKKGIESSV
jgi:squalene monooxygenase